MAAERQSRDCELNMHEATGGSLPLVCVVCGEATNQFFRVLLHYWGRKIWVSLPLCPSHENHWRHQSIARWVFLGTVSLLGVGIALVKGVMEFRPSWSPMALLAGSVLILAVAGLAITALQFLAARRIRVRRIGPTSLTLKHVAPEFVEVLRVYRREGLVSGPSPGLPALHPGPSESGGPRPPLAEETLLVVEAAGLTARAMGHDHIGTQHLLVALLVCNTAAAQALEGLGLDAEPLREACRSATRLAAKQPAMTELPSTPAVRRAIARAATEAGNRNHSTARAAHLLMAMLREPENEAVQRLLDLGISPQEAEQRVEVAIRFLEGVMAKDESLTRTPR